MENLKKELHWTSISLFALAAYQLVTLVNFILRLTRLDMASMGANAQALLPVFNVILAAGAALSVLVMIVLGVKGLKEAKQPTASRFHIVLAQIAGVISVIFTGTALLGLISSPDLLNELGAVLMATLITIDLISYAGTARKLRIA